MRENCWVPTYTAVAKKKQNKTKPKPKPERERERGRDGEDGKEKPEGHAFFPDRSLLSLVGVTVARESAWNKGKRGYTHRPVRACG